MDNGDGAVVSCKGIDINYEGTNIDLKGPMVSIKAPNQTSTFHCKVPN